MTAGLIDEFTDWLGERDSAERAAFAGHTETFLGWWGGRPLPALDDPDIREFLLDWCPRQLSLPAEESWQVCESLAEFVYFLGRTDRLRGGVARARALMRTALGLTDTMAAKMADPANYGMAKSLFAGIEGAESMTEQELREAVERRVAEHNALPFTERKAATDQFVGPAPRARELPFLHVPPPADAVAAVVATAALPAKIAALRDYLGETGKPLTAKGNLKLADGRALVAILDTGDEIDPTYGSSVYRTRSTETLPALMYLLAVADEAGAVRYVNKRLVPVKAWARRSPVDAATELFNTVIECGVLSTALRGSAMYAELHNVLDDGVVHWLAGLLAPGTSADVDDIAELIANVVSTSFEGRAIDYYLSGGGPAKDLSQILQALVMTGAIEWAGQTETRTEWDFRFWTGGTITLTAFGRQVLPEHLEPAGIVLRTPGNLTDVDLTDLIEAMDAIPSHQHSRVLAAWKPELPAPERAGLVATLAAEAADAETRLIGLRLLDMFDTAVAEPYMRQLLDTAAAGHAAIWLLEHGLADTDTVGGFLTPTVLIDILSLLLDQPAALCEQFLTAPDPEQLLEFFWRHPAPETAEVLDALGRHLPDPKLAKQARKAAIRHRGWMADPGRR